MRVVSPGFVGSLAVLFASVPAWAQVDPGQPASALFAARPQAARTVVLGHVFTSEGFPAAGAVITGSAGGRTLSAADGSFELAFDAPHDAQSVELTALLERDDGRLAVRSRIALEQARGPNAAGILTLGPAEDCRPGWLPTFGGIPGTDQPIFTLATFDDGDGRELYAGGAFLNAGGIPVRYVARWDGSSWSAVDGGNGGIYVLQAFDDGSGEALYAGGGFTSLGGSANHIARFDGTQWNRVGVTGLNDDVHALTMFDDGSGPALYAGGDFTGGSGVSMARVGKWNGTSWSALGSGINATVYALEVFDDGNGAALYAGGNFTSAGGIAASRIARWNGTSWSPLGGGISDPVWALETFDDGSGPALYAGGPFTLAGGSPASHIARWDGSTWTSVGGGVGSSVDALGVHDDGNGPALYASGRFTSAGGAPASHIARWDGTSWAPLGSGVSGGLGTTSGLATYDDGNGAGPALFVAGGFSSAGGLVASNVARWSGTSWTSLGNGLTSYVTTQAVFDEPGSSGPALYAGGILGVGGTTARGVARWSGTQWSALPGIPSFGFAAHAMTVFDDGNGAGPALFVGGSFRASTGAPGNYIARWDGTSWAPLGSGMSGLVRALAVFDDGGGPALYAGGDFGLAGGLSAGGIARWNGSQWSTFGWLGILGATGMALAVFDDGSGPALYVGGAFTRAGSVAANNIARWDGAHWSPLGSGTNNRVEALAVFDDGSGPALIAAGLFTSAGGVAARRIARWDGTSWSALAGGLNDQVHALTVFDDLGPGGPALYAGGDFRSASGVAANRIARWDGAQWSPLGRGLSDSVYSLIVFDDPLRSAPTLVAGGFFDSAVDSRDSYLALWQGWSCADTLAPTLACPAAITIADLGAPGEVVLFTVTASDDLDPAPTLQCVPPSGNTFPPGETLVTCKATDAAGNQATCEFTVRVVAARHGRPR